MSKVFSLFAKDGLKINGLLPDDPFSNIAKEITNGYISLYFRSSPTSIILGSCFNLKRTSGGREEGFIVIGEFTHDEIKISSFDFFQNYFHEAMDFVIKSGYDVLDLYGEQRIKDQNFKIPQNNDKKELAKIVSGKLLFSKSFIYSTDFINSLSFFSYFIDNMKPILTAEYTFVISKLIVPADLIICSNKHPDESKIDIDFNSVSINLPREDSIHFLQIGENLSKISFEPVSINTKDIVRSIVQTIITSERNEYKREEIFIDWTLFLFEKYPGENTVKLNAKTAIEQLYLGSRKYFQIYVNSNQYNLEDIQSNLRKFNFADFDQIEKALNLITFNTPERGAEVFSVFKSVKKEKTITVTKITPSFKYESSGYERPQPEKREKFKKIAFIAAVIVIILLLILGLNSLVLHIDPLNLFPAEKQSNLSTSNLLKTTNNPLLDSCSKDNNNIDCNLPACCLKSSSDKLAQLYIPTIGIDTSTKSEIKQKQNSDMKYGSTLTYQNMNFRLQDNILYRINIQNFTPSSKSTPQLKIMTQDPSTNYKRVVISKYNTETNEWSKPESEPKQGASATINLENNVDDSFGLFIEYKK